MYFPNISDQLLYRFRLLLLLYTYNGHINYDFIHVYQ